MSIDRLILFFGSDLAGAVLKTLAYHCRNVTIPAPTITADTVVGGKSVGHHVLFATVMTPTNWALFLKVGGI